METLQKNQIHTAQITGYASDGAGVCRICGRAVFVKNTIPGEVWDVKILKVTASAVYGRGEVCHTPSPARQEPPCPVYRKCGGCSLQHMTYDEELRMKLGRVNDALERIGGLDFRIAEILGAEQPEHYRNKAIYAVADVNGMAQKGFYRSSTHELVPVERCLLQSELADRAAETVCSWMNDHHFPAYSEASGKGTVRHIFTRVARYTQDAVLCIVTARGFGSLTEDLVQTLRTACPELTGVVLCVNKQKGNVVLDGDFHTLWGKAEMEDLLCGLRFEVAPQAFFQINPAQAERLYQKAVEYAVVSPSDQILDLYCGAGTITLCLAGSAGHVIGAEIVPEAIENAKKNAETNNNHNIEFICADAGEAAKMLAQRGLKPDCITVDPPRKGLSDQAIEAILSMSPKRIVYVSCDPGTLARDLKQFCAHGYALAAGTAVDMFPHTPHVETVVLLSKGNISSQNVRVEFSLEDMDMSLFRQGATYEQIQEWVQEKYGFHVTHLNIAKTKRKCGITERINYNLPKSENSKSPGTPKEKEEAIIDAFRHFQMI